MWPAEHTQDFHQNMTFDPIKDGTLGAATPKQEACRFNQDTPPYKIRQKSVKKCSC